MTLAWLLHSSGEVYLSERTWALLVGGSLGRGIAAAFHLDAAATRARGGPVHHAGIVFVESSAPEIRVEVRGGIDRPTKPIEYLTAALFLDGVCVERSEPVPVDAGPSTYRAAFLAAAKSTAATLIEDARHFLAEAVAQADLAERTAPMQRAGLTRKTPLRRGKALRRVNPARRRAFARNFGDRAPAVRAMACLCSAEGRRGMTPPNLRDRCAGAIEAAHVRARGMGGAKGDRRDLVPLCTYHHQRQHQLGVHRFAEIYGVDLQDEARRIAGELDERGIP
ncbi:MAG: hypothetical protein JNL82_29750 [Myxococcales bacterium]|nr:hypothetical protein [Myxococcales bacterium]